MKDAADLAILAAAGGAAGLLWFALPTPKPSLPAGVEATALVATPAPLPAKATPQQHPAEDGPAPTDPASLSRKLQVELKRVGCYDGEPHGVWSKSTRLAMKAFTERVNARLPVDRPDQILLALVQGYQGRACSAACGEGFAPTADGRCVPEAIPAKTDPRPEAEGPRSARLANTASPPPAPAPARSASPPDEAANAGSPSKAALVPIPAPLPRLVAPPREATRALEPPPAGEPPRERRAMRADGPVPSVGVREGRPRRHLRGPSRQVRYARSIFRSLKRAASSALPFP